MPSTSDPGFRRGLRFGAWTGLLAVAASDLTSSLTRGATIGVLAVIPADRTAGALVGAISVLAAVMGVLVLMSVLSRTVEEDDAVPSPVTLIAVGGLLVVSWVADLGGSMATNLLVSQNAASNLSDYYGTLAMFQWLASAIHRGGFGAGLAVAWMRAGRTLG